MLATTHRATMTVQEFAALPDTPGKTELLFGEVMEEMPTKPLHLLAEQALVRLLARYMLAREAGERSFQWYHVGGGEAGFLVAEDTILAPDITITDRREVARQAAANDFYAGAPLVAIEILSPSNTYSEIAAKVALYLGAGADQAWVVDPAARCIVVHTKATGPVVFRQDERLVGTGILAGLEFPVAVVFDVPPSTP